VMKSVLCAPLLALVLGSAAYGQASAVPTKVGIINIQNAIAQTRDGQKAAADLETKYGPRRRQVEQKQSELQSMETQYRNTANTMSDDARQKLARDIEVRRKQLQRDMDDAQAELQQDQDNMVQELGRKIMAIIDRYAADHGYSLILDVSTQPSPVLFASNTIEITRDIVEQYDRSQAGGAAAGTPAPSNAAPTAPVAPRPATPRPAAPKPATPKP
jgi:outer membrane protein